jgi:hypothetical protein
VPPQAIAALKFARAPSTQPANADTTLAFLSESMIAVRLCTPFDWRAPARTCQLQVAALDGGHLRIVAETETTEKPTWTHEVFGMSNGGILLTSSTIQYLYSPDLKTRREIPIRSAIVCSAPSNVVGETESDLPNRQWRWTLYRVSPRLEAIRDGRGTLYGVSDEYVMFFLDGAVRVETLDGRLLGLHTVDPESGSSYVPEIIGPGRLYLGGDKPAITDFNGQELRRLRVPGGHGARDSWSADGTRMAFDHFIQTPTTLAELVEKYLSLPIPRGANGEEIRVVDTSNGGVCLKWESPGRLFGMVYQHHADLSPSGRLLAAVTPTDLSVYRLPEACTSR